MIHLVWFNLVRKRKGKQKAGALHLLYHVTEFVKMSPPEEVSIGTKFHLTIPDLTHMMVSDDTDDKAHDGKGDVYIKLRVELLSEYGEHTTFVMSFHYAEIPFTPDMFPYRKQ